MLFLFAVACECVCSNFVNFVSQTELAESTALSARLIHRGHSVLGNQLEAVIVIYFLGSVRNDLSECIRERRVERWFEVYIYKT